ncbi:MAG: hypothetical protein ACXVFA_19110 [Solirubrobacteraceae bacterium]
MSIVASVAVVAAALFSVLASSASAKVPRGLSSIQWGPLCRGL